jgi:xyloglucan fucosyltransferase
VAAESKKDALLGGLLLPGFDEQTCASRYQSVYYRKNLTRQPSPYLIKRLREQEALQRRCGPGTEPYARASERLRSGQTGAVDNVDVDGDGGCRYLVLISYRGLGNRMLAITSAFLYALLTRRVLLVDRGYGNTLPDLFCEPFPGTTWALPLDFPLDKEFRDLDETAPESYGNVAVNRSGSVSGMRFVYLHLDHAASQANRLVYCDDDEPSSSSFLRRMQWAILRTDQYMVPGLFFNPAHQGELDRLFPRKDSVFYLLSRYLLHPTNDVWGMVTRYYNAYLSGADERLGIQIRVLFGGDKPAQHVLDQILACTSRERLLPGVVTTQGPAPAPPLPAAAGARARRRSKAVLVTGLSGWYHDSIREMYWESPAADGEVVSLFQPSHEEHQLWYQNKHDMKAAAEIYLLSLTDNIVTSAWSTFGYVGYALGGLRPYLMFLPENQTAPDPPCTRAMSMEPCSHGAPSFECTRKEIGTIINTGLLLPHVRACEDISWGLKLTDPDEV